MRQSPSGRESSYEKRSEPQDASRDTRRELRQGAPERYFGTRPRQNVVHTVVIQPAHRSSSRECGCVREVTKYRNGRRMYALCTFEDVSPPVAKGERDLDPAARAAPANLATLFYLISREHKPILRDGATFCSFAAAVHRTLLAMGAWYDEIPNDDILKWMLEQKLWFVASAPLSGKGHVNLSPRGKSRPSAGVVYICTKLHLPLLA